MVCVSTTRTLEFREILGGYFGRAYGPAQLGRRRYHHHFISVIERLLKNGMIKGRRRRGGFGQFRGSLELLQESCRIQFGIVPVGIFPEANDLGMSVMPRFFNVSCGNPEVVSAIILTMDHPFIPFLVWFIL